MRFEQGQGLLSPVRRHVSNSKSSSSSALRSARHTLQISLKRGLLLIDVPAFAPVREGAPESDFATLDETKKHCRYNVFLLQAGLFYRM